VHRDGLKTAFDPLREQLEQVKATFWEKHGEKLEAGARTYIQQKIKDRVQVEASRSSTATPRHSDNMCAQVKKQLRRYAAYLENNKANNRELKEVAETS